jgi:hypothetical protein
MRALVLLLAACAPVDPYDPKDLLNTLSATVPEHPACADGQALCRLLADVGPAAPPEDGTWIGFSVPCRDRGRLGPGQGFVAALRGDWAGARVTTMEVRGGEVAIDGERRVLSADAEGHLRAAGPYGWELGRSALDGEGWWVVAESRSALYCRALHVFPDGHSRRLSAKNPTAARY